MTIGNGVTSIGDYAFYECDSLTSITIPDSVTAIGAGVFRNCESLVTITVDVNNSVYHSAGNCIIETESKTLIAGCKSSIIPTDGSVTSIGDGAFSSCTSLTSITIPDGVTSIGDRAFYYCDSLTSITIPDSVTSIGDGAFLYCRSLTSITIPDSVTTILEEAFSVCTSLTSVTIPESVTAIGAGVFRNCESLVTITVDVNNSVYHSAGNCIIETESKTLIAGCKSSIIPTDGSVTSIGVWAFSSCTSLTSITIPDSVTSIGEYAFRLCTSLASITIPDSVTSIGHEAFSYCSSLTSVTILSKTATIYDSEYTIDDGATIYGYTGSTAEAYATKYGRTFVALDETEELIDGSLVGFQVTKGENGAFSLRAIAGLNSLDYKNFGYEVTITIKDEDGNCAVKPLSGMDDKAYSSIYGGNTAYSIKETFGYEYAGLATITNLAIDSIYTKLEIRPFVTTMDGEKQYGKSGTFLYTGELDDDGYPSLSFIADTECEHSVPDDMECCEGYTCSLCGAVVEHSHEYDESSIRVSNVLVTTDPEQDIVAVLLQLQCAKSCCTEPTTVTVMETGNVFLYDDIDGNEVLSANDTISFDYELDGVVYSIVAIFGDGYWTEEVSAR